MTTDEAAALARCRPSLQLRTEQGIMSVVCPTTAQGVLDAYATAEAAGATVVVKVKPANRTPLTDRQRAANERIHGHKCVGEWRR